jgi:hypothetical protein
MTEVDPKLLRRVVHELAGKRLTDACRGVELLLRNCASYENFALTHKGESTHLATYNSDTKLWTTWPSEVKHAIISTIAVEARDQLREAHEKAVEMRMGCTEVEVDEEGEDTSPLEYWRTWGLSAEEGSTLRKCLRLIGRESFDASSLEA